MKRSHLLILVCLVAAGLLLVVRGESYGTYQQAGTQTQSAAESASGEVITVKNGRISLLREVVLASERPGVIDWVKAEEGERVEAGTLVVHLRSEMAEAALASAALKATNTIDLQYAEAQREVSKKEWELHKAVQERRESAINQLEIDLAELKYVRSKFQYEQADFQMQVDELARQEAEANLKSFQIHAPFSGMVTKLHKRFRGEAVSQGEPILEMVNTDFVLVEAKVPLKDALRIQQGALAEVQLDLSGSIDDLISRTQSLVRPRPRSHETLEIEKKVVPGRVILVDPRATNTRPFEVLVKIKVKNPENIFRKNLTATVRFHPDRKGPVYEEEKEEEKQKAPEPGEPKTVNLDNIEIE